MNDDNGDCSDGGIVMAVMMRMVAKIMVMGIAIMVVMFEDDFDDDSHGNVLAR